MAVTTVGEFCAVLEKSKLLDAAQMAQARDLVEKCEHATAAAKTLARRGLISRWQAAQLLLGRRTFTLGKYRLIQMLGRGGMGSVCLAEHVTMNRRVALKIISREVGKDPAALQRFLAEARAVAALDHPNIVQAYNVDNEGDRYYLVMEYVEGMDLQRLVEVEGPLECERAVDYIRQAADGLDHAHQRGMVHRDIKPSNLLLNSQGVIKILDLGLAKLADDKPGGGEQDESVLGSVDYLAPEQALGSPNLDGRADIYSLGCTFYFLLTGHPPFPQGSLHERILKHQTQEPVAIRSQRPEVPAELAECCARMMAKEPADRYQTAGEAGGQLMEWRPAAAGLPRAIPLPRAKAIDDSSSEAVFDAEFEKDASRSALDFLPGGPPASLDAKLATLTSSNPNLTTLDASVVLAPRREATKRGLFGLPPIWSRVLVASVAALAVLVVGTVLAVAMRGHGGSHSPSVKAPVSTGGAEPYAATESPTEADPETQKKQAEAEKQQKKLQEMLAKIETMKAAAQQPANPAPPSPGKTAKPGKSKGAAPVASAPPPPAEPAKPEDQFKGLKDAADLPALPGNGKWSEALGKPDSLGKLRLAADTALQVAWIGGEKAFADKGARYVLREEPGSGTARSWVIHVDVDNAASPSPGGIARIWLDQTDLNLKICWLQGVTPALANPLRGWGLVVSAGNQSRTVALFRPQEVEPLSIEMQQKGSSREYSYTFTSRELPSDIPPSELWLEITGLTKPFPSFTLAPGRPIAPGGQIEARLDDPQFPPTTLSIEFEVESRTAKFTLTPLCVLPRLTKAAASEEAAASEKEPPTLKPLRMREFRDLFQKLVNLQKRQPYANPKTKEGERVQTQLNQLKSLGNLSQALFNNNGKAAYFRLFRQIGDHQVNLLVAPLPKSAKPKPAAEKKP
jgi:serine/threonine protein kinase